MKDILIGRKPEIALLEKIKNLEKSAFVAVYGRRRVGKTFLIRKTLGEQFTFQVTGRANSNLKLQLVNFRCYLEIFSHCGEEACAQDLVRHVPIAHLLPRTAVR